MYVCWRCSYRMDIPCSCIYADVTLHFDGGRVTAFINGREADTASYSADPNAGPEDRIVQTDGLFCRDGSIKELRFRDGYRGDEKILTGQLVGSDGATREIVFHTSSEEALYIVTEDGGAPVFAIE